MLIIMYFLPLAQLKGASETYKLTMDFLYVNKFPNKFIFMSRNHFYL